MFRLIEWLFSRTGKNPFKRHNVKGNVICEKTVATEGTFRNFLSIPLFVNVVGRITRAECPSVCLDFNCGRVGGGHKETEAEREIWVMYVSADTTQQNWQNSPFTNRKQNWNDM